MNKRQLQQTLREMGIEYPPDATHANLMEILDRENQTQWMKSAAGRVIKISKKSGPLPPGPEKSGPKSPGTAKTHLLSAKPSRAGAGAFRTSYPNLEKATQPDAPQAGSLISEPRRSNSTPTPIFDPTRDLEKYALKRASGVCDLCETSVGKAGQKLKAFLFTEQPGRPPTVKNVAALCPGCFSRIQSEGLGSAIKLLKRKARSRINANPKISHRNQKKITTK
jgi:hypothetical protein